MPAQGMQRSDWEVARVVSEAAQGTSTNIFPTRRQVKAETIAHGQPDEKPDAAPNDVGDLFPTLLHFVKL